MQPAIDRPWGDVQLCRLLDNADAAGIAGDRRRLPPGLRVPESVRLKLLFAQLAKLSLRRPLRTDGFAVLRTRQVTTPK